MDNTRFFILLAVMVITTYLIRAVPFILFRKKIENRKIKAFFDYIPYTVLSAMTFPAILYSTDSIIAAAGGFFVALFLSYKKKSLLVVAIGTCLATFILSFALHMAGSL
ncbi:MAG: AzlD domain-containing protein [Clostridiales bacterium]|nr:AzlD domain-containing protein [Clostridiales bacterium]